MDLRTFLNALFISSRTALSNTWRILKSSYNGFASREGRTDVNPFDALARSSRRENPSTCAASIQSESRFPPSEILVEAYPIAKRIPFYEVQVAQGRRSDSSIPHELDHSASKRDFSHHFRRAGWAGLSAILLPGVPRPLTPTSMNRSHSSSMLLHQVKALTAIDEPVSNNPEFMSMEELDTRPRH
jgi:hypothetical protein